METCDCLIGDGQPTLNMRVQVIDCHAERILSILYGLEWDGCNIGRKRGRRGGGFYRSQRHERWVLLQAVGETGGVSRLRGNVAQGYEKPLVQRRLQIVQEARQQLSLGLSRSLSY